MSLFDRTPDRRERTADERERARLEREAQRTTAPPPATAPPPTTAATAPRAQSQESLIDEPVAEDWSAFDDHVEVAAPADGRRGPWRWIPLALLVAIVLAAAWFLVSLFQPFHGNGHDAVEVRIPANVGVSKIGDVLAQRGVVSSSFFFALRVRLGGNSGALKPGLYALKRDMSYGAAIDALVKGPEAAKTIAVTIPEGRSIHETDARLKVAKIPLTGDYAAAARRSPLLDPRAYGAPRSTPSLEGFLFPSTYEVRVGASVSTLVAKQLQAFKQSFAHVDMRAPRRKNLNPYDVLTIASMVEREAQLDRERPLVAAVIYNRLKQGVPLGIDATTRYEHNNWTQPLSDADFDSSPYNTRRHKDLTPTPIGNPGLASIQAAAHPARVKYLYYVVKPGVCGEHAFSTTYAQFLKDAQRYDTARAAKGNRSPTTCR
jgi:UPF0755 protein